MLVTVCHLFNWVTLWSASLLSVSEVSRLSSPFQGESRPERSHRGEGFELWRCVVDSDNN